MMRSSASRVRGLVVTGTHPNRTLLDVSGAVEDIERVFGVTMRLCQHGYYPSDITGYESLH
jgi:hypothetical protein